MAATEVQMIEAGHVFNAGFSHTQASYNFETQSQFCEVWPREHHLFSLAFAHVIAMDMMAVEANGGYSDEA